MNVYKCFVVGQDGILDRANWRTIEAATSFEARKQMAAAHGVHVTDCIACREQHDEHMHDYNWYVLEQFIRVEMSKA